MGRQGNPPHLTPDGPCVQEMADPVLAGSPGENLRRQISKPKTWQEQVAAESNPKKDEFDLGDLDF